MLALQKYLQDHTLEQLTAEFAITVREHPTLPLVNFKYSQTDSPKTNAIVRECRGIVLEKSTWKVVAKAFDRFFNVGEVAEEFATFNWNDFTVTDKEDGSLAIVYHYGGEWHVNTSGSFGLGQGPNGYRGSWRDLFWETAPFTPRDLGFHEGVTFVFELCTLWNKVVRSYRKPQVFLLGVFHVDGEEALYGKLQQLSKALKTPVVAYHEFFSQEEVREFLLAQEEKDATYEGVVLRDNTGLRYKWKTSTYVALHRLKDNGNILLPKRIVPIILANEQAEVLATMPECTTAFVAVKDRLSIAYAELYALWELHKGEASQKDFAIGVKHHKLSGILFQARKSFQATGEEAFHVIWRQSAKMIVKCLFSKYETFAFDILEEIDG